MSAYDADFYSADDLDDLEDFGEWEAIDEDAFDEADAFDWARALNTAASIGESVYGNYGGRWGKQNRAWDSAIRGALGALKGASKSWFQDGIDGDPFEPEFETDEIDAMEEVAADALSGGAEERAMAADELVGRSFGPTRSAQALRPVLMALRAQVRRILMGARRDPQMRLAARLAPLALRRTAAIVTRKALARRQVSVRMAMSIFRGILSRLMRSRALRGRAIALSRRRISRARRGDGGRYAVMRRRGGYGMPPPRRRLPRPEF